MLLLFVASTLGELPRPAFTDTFPWARTPTMCQTHIPGGIFVRRDMAGTGRFADEVVAFLANNMALVVANGLEPGLPSQCAEAAVGELADRIHAVNPNSKVILYQANMIVHSHKASLMPTGVPETLLLCGLDNVAPSMLARDPATGTLVTTHGGSQYIHNLSDPAMRAQWLNVVLNKSLGNHVAGVFADNSFDGATLSSWMTPDVAAAYMEGQQSLLASVVAAGKYVIFNGLRLHYNSRGKVTDDIASLDTELPYGSSGYFEPWLGYSYRPDRTTGKLDATLATHALLRMINASTTQPTKGVAFRAGPGPCVGFIGGQAIGCTWPFANHSTPPVPNEMNGTPETTEARRAAAAKLITFPLATFLCAAGPKWHFDYGWGYAINDFVPGQGPNSTIAGQPKMQSNVPDNWYPELLRAPGTPSGPCVHNAATSTFSREWSGVSVKLSMATETAVLTWK